MTEDELVARISPLNSALFFDELESTNDYAKSAIESAELSFPFIIFTVSQTKGRGRAGRSWESSEGSLTFSLVVSAVDCPIPTHLISILFGLVVAKALNRACNFPMCKIKWPNDVYANGKKISGILIESVQARGRGIIVGCGINVNNSFKRALSSKLVATSFFDETEQNLNPKELMADIVDAFFIRMRDFLALGHDADQIPESILREFRNVDFLTDKRVTVRVGHEEIAGEYCGIGQDGAMQLNVNGEIHAFHSGSIVKIDE